jgi:hypothetical protein
MLVLCVKGRCVSDFEKQVFWFSREAKSGEMLVFGTPSSCGSAGNKSVHATSLLGVWSMLGTALRFETARSLRAVELNFEEKVIREIDFRGKVPIQENGFQGNRWSPIICL